MAHLCNYPDHVAITLCDFCGDAIFIKAYACRSFVYLKGTPVEQETGEQWAACAECAYLIDRQKWNRLTERAVRAFFRGIEMPNRDLHVLREQLQHLHGAFRQYMIAEA
jgi:hypothetical protein